jgi:hypothetical protein
LPERTAEGDYYRLAGCKIFFYQKYAELFNRISSEEASAELQYESKYGKPREFNPGILDRWENILFNLSGGDPVIAEEIENVKLGRVYYFLYMKRVKNLNQLLSTLKSK